MFGFFKALKAKLDERPEIVRHVYENEQPRAGSRPATREEIRGLTDDLRKFKQALDQENARRRNLEL